MNNLYIIPLRHEQGVVYVTYGLLFGVILFGIFFSVFVDYKCLRNVKRTFTVSIFVPWRDMGQEWFCDVIASGSAYTSFPWFSVIVL